ncbi:hypothetical protein D3C71_1623420 [compost metagenome]
MCGIHDLAQLQMPGTVAQLLHLGIQRFTAKLPGRAAGPCFVGEYGVELDGVDLGEVETACLHLAQDVAADIVVLAAHETSS